MQTAFVTGGTGFVGLNLVAQLKQGGWKVIAIHRESSSTKRLEGLGAELRKAGLDDPSALARALPEGVDAVFHVAGDVSWSSLHEERQRRANVDGTRHMVEAALLRKAKRFVHTSSVAAFGHDHAVIDERTPSTAADSSIGYVRTKWFGQEEVRRGIQRGLSAVILNPANIMGPYDTTSWARLFRMLKQGKLPGVPPGSASFCHVREVARAHVEAVTRGGSGEQYLLGGTDATYVEVAAIMAELLRVKAPRPVPAFVVKTLGRVNDWVSYLTRKEPDITAANAEFVCSRWRVDSSKAEQELGFRRRTLREMVEDSFRWLEQEKLI
jgi:nucleoside-diphosphate-sugar epimerase